MMGQTSGTRTITFDFYGTLVQWHEAVEAAFRAIVTRHGKPALDRAALIHAFHAEGRRLRDTPPWRPYRDVLRGSLRFALDRGGLVMSETDIEGLIAGLSRLPAHADVPSALAALRAGGWRLAAISNTDDDLISGSLPSLGLELDAVITAQQARAYKPDLRLFRHAHAVLDVTPQQTLHVAASQPLDMAACKALGIGAYWVNRRAETADPQWRPFTEVKDVAEAAVSILR